MEEFKEQRNRDFLMRGKFQEEWQIEEQLEILIAAEIRVDRGMRDSVEFL